MQVDAKPEPIVKQSSLGELPFGIWIGGLISRTLFIAVLIVLTARVAHPQNETIWSAYETPGDLVRMLVGLGLGIWLMIHLFILPKDAAGYRTWIYLAPLIPLAVLCTYVVW